MSCLCNQASSNCNSCRNFIKTFQVIVDDTNVILTVPAKTFEAYQRVMLCIAQNIPATATALPVLIQSGTAQYPLTTPDGTAVTSMQIKSRTVYSLTAIPTPAGFVVSERCLRYSSPITPPTTGA